MGSTVEGDSSWTGWFAIDYGCAMIKRRVVFEDGSTSTKDLVSMKSGEPDPELFELSPSLIEGPPSRLRGSCTTCTTVVRDAKRDDNYYQHPPKQLVR